MSQMQTTPMRPRPAKSRSNVYTVLIVIAAIALAVGIGTVIHKSKTLYGDQVGLFEVVQVR